MPVCYFGRITMYQKNDMDLNGGELLAIARMRGTQVGGSIPICGTVYRMCMTENGSPFMHISAPKNTLAA